MINLKQIENDTKRIYDESFELSLLQEQLEDMLTAIDKNNIEFEDGRISKTAFKTNENKLKKNSVKLIKNIKSLIETNLILLGGIEEEIKNQSGEKDKKKSRKAIIKKIEKATERVVESGSN